MADAPAAPPSGFDEELEAMRSKVEVPPPPTAAQAPVHTAKHKKATTAPPPGFDDELDSLKEEAYGSAGQQLITGAEGLAEGVAGPLAPMLETGLGLSTPEDMKARAEVNPVTKGVAELGGLMLPMGQGKLLAKAGSLATEATGLAQGAGYIAKAAEMGARGAVESALFQGGKEVTNMFMRAPDEAADNAIANIGAAALMGGVFGGALGAAQQALTSKAPEALVSQLDAPRVEAGELDAVISADAAIPAKKKYSLIEAVKIGKQKANAKEITAAQELLGAPVTPAMTLESPLVQMQVDALSNSPYTLAGSKIRNTLDTAYETAETQLKGATSSANSLSKDELGASLQNSLTESTRAAYAPQKAAFEELSAMHQSIPLETNLVDDLKKTLLDVREVKLGSKTESGLVKEVLRLAENAKTADDISVLKNIADLKDTSGAGGSDPLRWLKAKIKDGLNDLQDEAVKQYAKSFPRNDEAGALMSTLVDKADMAKAGYKPYIQKLSSLSQWLGKGKIHGTEDALNFMNERLSATDVAKRIFSSAKDPEFIKFFSKEFPEQYAMVRDFQRMELLDSATTGDALNSKVFFNKFNKLEPEIQKALYTADEIKKIKAAETYIRHAFPPNFNPSGTSHMEALRGAYQTPKSMIFANVRDAAMEKFIQAASGAPELKNASRLGKATVDGFNTAKKGVAAIFDATKELPANVIPILAHREKLAKLVDAHVADPSKIFAVNDNNPVQEYHAPFAASTGRIVSYLNSVKPDTNPKNPMDARQPANDVQKAQYNRALDIAQQPLSVLNHIKQGTLLPSDIQAMQAMYPGLYSQLQQQLTSQMIDHMSKGKAVPYTTRMGLSMFIGQPLDSTMTPQAIISAQPKPQEQPQQQQGNPPPASSVKALGKSPSLYKTPGQAAEQGGANRTK